MRFRLFLPLAGVLLGAVACLGGSGAGDVSEAPDANEVTPGPIDSPSQPTDLAWIYDAPYDPINLTTTLDESGMAEAVIPVEGGTLMATGADGTTYTLEIPADALLVETRISLTPVENLSGLPFSDETAYAVQLAPEGLSFHNFVTLTIVPSQDIPLGEQIMFGYQADGQALSLALPGMDPGSIEIQLLHFSGAGVSKGLLADIEPVRRRLGGDVEARLDSAMAAAIQQARQDGQSIETISATLLGYVNEYIEKVVNPRIAAAGESCAAGRLAKESILRAERSLQLLGGGSIMSKYDALVGPVGELCMKEEYELCRDDHIVHRIVDAWRSILREMQLHGVDGSGLGQYVEKCLRFDLELDSTALASYEGALFESRVTSKVSLNATVDDIEVTIEGEAPAYNESYTVTLPGCTTAPSRGGGTFTVSDLHFDVGTVNKDDQLGFVRDLRLLYDPGMTSETFTMTCSGFSVPAASVLWSELFVVAHDDELSSEGFLAQGWEVLSEDLFAQKEWNETKAAEGGTVTENGSFKLHHRPQ